MSDEKPQFDVQALKIDRGARRGRRRRRSSLTTPLVLLALAGGLGWLFQRQLLELVDSVRLPAVEATPVVSRSAGAAAGAAGVSANGYVIARTRAALSADAPGRIVEMNVVEGSRVSAGDVVARLYHDEFEAALEQATADLAASETSVARAGTQVEEARSTLAGLRAARDSAAAVLEEARAREAFAVTDFERIERLVNEGIERQQFLDAARRDLDAARARTTSSESELRRAEAELLRGESSVAVAEASLVEARSRVASALAARDLAAATLEKTFVRAPFDGIVTQKEAEVGEVVSPNSQGGSLARGSVVTMVDMGSLEVQTDVPETTLAQVRGGQPARIYLDAFPDDAYAGQVDRIWPTADRQKATVEVRVAFLETDERLRPEMGVRVVFLDEEPEPAAQEQVGPVILVDQRAITRRDGAEGVFLIESDRVRFLPVLLGGSEGQRRAVLEGLEEGQRVVLEPADNLEDSARVRVEED